jgi:hypothetical protein
MNMRTVRLGEIIPVGLSKREDGYLLRLPLMARLMTWYEAASDRMIHGWWAFNICARFGGEGFRLRGGWALIRSV